MFLFLHSRKWLHQSRRFAFGHGHRMAVNACQIGLTGVPGLMWGFPGKVFARYARLVSGGIYGASDPQWLNRFGEHKSPLA